jgi:hypothetical protein
MRAYLVLLVMLSATALGLGITPATQDLEFAEGKEYNLTYRVYNTASKDISVSIAANGSLAKYIQLDKQSLKFSKNDRYKVVVANVRLPDEARDLKATIKASDGKLDVFALINVDAPEPTPTGMFLEGESRNPYLIPIFLGLVVVGNIVYFAVARLKPKPKLESPEDLLSVLRTIDDAAFREYVNSEKNEFADWLDEINMPELALKIYDINTREEMISAVEAFLARPEGAKSSEELKSEIVELKHELDSFEMPNQ